MLSFEHDVDFKKLYRTLPCLNDNKDSLGILVRYTTLFQKMFDRHEWGKFD
jgi:hypothetical protein